MAITCNEAVLELKKIRRSTTAKELADRMNTDSRAVATALRKATEDGRVAIIYGRRRGIGLYRFKRLTPKQDESNNITQKDHHGISK